MRQQCRESFGGVRHFRRNQLAVAFVDGFGPGVVGESTGEDTDPRSEVESFSEVKRYLKQIAQTSARIRDDEAPAMEIQHTEWAGPPSSRIQESLGHAPMEGSCREEEPAEATKGSRNLLQRTPGSTVGACRLACDKKHLRWASCTRMTPVAMQWL